MGERERRTKGADEVFCSSCGEPIKRETEICPHCGVRNRSAPATSRSQSRSQREVRPPEQGGSMLGDAIEYPIRGDEGAKNVLIGGVLSALWFLFFLPTLFVFGYLVRVIATTADGEDFPPRFDDWGRLGVDGVVGTVLSAVFYLVPVVVFVLIAGVGGVTGNESLATAGTAVAALVSIPLFVAFVYLYPAVLAEFAVGYRGDRGFETGRIVDAITSTSYLVAWLVGFFIQIGAFVALSILGLVPLIGLSVLIVGPFVAFAANVAAFRAFGVAYRSATGTSATG
ncbi:DUF4013 domain-containing protein [Salinigranum sp. GCM10025319]|uniref:DUF4013 domain-containing protein n=1 Tax=Salinigranum sp. GCM10025319 TaxID=3252687 RepID=UPI00361532CA